jgi:hypothetical protein
VSDTVSPVVPRYYALPCGVVPPAEPIEGLRFCVDGDGLSRCVRVEQPVNVEIGRVVRPGYSSVVSLAVWTADRRQIDVWWPEPLHAQVHVAPLP